MQLFLFQKFIYRINDATYSPGEKTPTSQFPFHSDFLDAY